MTDLSRLTQTPTQLVGYLDKLDLLFETEKTWTKGAGAVDGADKGLSDPCDSRAQAWCLIGGTYMLTNAPSVREHHQAHAEVMMCVRRALDKRGLHITVGEFNDQSSFDEVKTLIAEARAEALSGGWGPLDLDIPSRLR